MKKSKRHPQPAPPPAAAPAPVTVRRRSRFEHSWIPGLLLLVITVIAYWPALAGGFIWDDDAHLTANPCVVGPLGLKELWTSAAARICPLVQTTFWGEFHLWGLRPLPYHLVNILLHALNGVILWRVLRALQIPGAWLGAALWALHPVQAESAAWVTELKNTQSGLFFLLSVLCFVKWRKSPPPGRAGETFYALALLCGALAMASKSSTVILPLVLGLCAWWIARRWCWRDALRVAPFFLFTAAAVALSMWTQKLEGATGAEYVRSWAERLVTAGRVLWFYPAKLLWPHPLIFIYPRWQIDPAQATAWLPLVAAGALLSGCWWNRHGWGRPWLFAAAGFVVCLLPVLGIVDHYFLRYSFVGDHFQYLASMAALGGAGAGITKLQERAGQLRRPLAVAAGAVLLTVLAALTWRHAAVFHDDEVLWRDTLVRNPSCWLAQNDLGTVLSARKQDPEAAVHFRACLRLNPRNVNALDNLADILVGKGFSTEAEALYRRALQLNPAKVQAWDGLGGVLAGRGRLPEAIDCFRHALRANPRDLDALDQLGKALAASGQAAEATRCLREAVRLAPDSATEHCNLGNALAGQSQYAEAIGEYQAALRLTPDYAHAQFNLAAALEALGRKAEAIDHYREALRLEPGLAPARQQLKQLGALPAQ
jgi:protein O-mannosyl-transferase